MDEMYEIIFHLSKYEVNINLFTGDKLYSSFYGHVLHVTVLTVVIFSNQGK